MTTPSWIKTPKQTLTPETERPSFVDGLIASTERPVFAEAVDDNSSTDNLPPLAKFNPEPQGGLVKTWSPTMLQQMGQCPYKIYLRRVKKFKTADSEAASRGSRIHDLAEQYVDGTLAEMPAEIEKFDVKFERMRFEYERGQVICEQDWGFDRQWGEVDINWRKPVHWGMMKLDLMFFESEVSAVVVDYKTGRKFGNEMKHNWQGQTYAIGAFLRYPELEFVKTEFWYLDKKEELINTYTREQAMVFLPGLTEKADLATRMIQFPPEPSISKCKWCDYAKDGRCEYGV
jgi:RecB family exonuclease